MFCFFFSFSFVCFFLRFFHLFFFFFFSFFLSLWLIFVVAVVVFSRCIFCFVILEGFIVFAIVRERECA